MDETEDVALELGLVGAAFLSNGRYQVLLTDAGTGYSALDGYALTRWQAAGSRGIGGTFLYVQDFESGVLWSAAHEPTRRPADQYEAWLGPGCYHVRRSDHGIEIQMEVCVAPDAPAEIRRYTFTNLSTQRRRLRVTSYTEPVMHRAPDDAAHPAFSKLFIQTEFLPEIGGVLARRRPRSPEDHFPLLVHAFGSSTDSERAADGAGDVEQLFYDTDRASFIGRGRSLCDPQALSSASPLPRTVGGVLDPAISLQKEIVLDPDDEMELAFVSAAGYSKEEAIGTAAQFRGKVARAEAFLNAALNAQRDRDRFKLGPKNADRYHRVAVGIVLGNAELRAPVEMPGHETGGADALRILGLDRARPLVLARVSGADELAVARLALKARDYWTTLGFGVQILILNDKSGADADDLQQELKEAIAASAGGHGGVVLRHSDTLPDDVQRTVQSLASFVLNGDRISILHVRSDDSFSYRQIGFPVFREPWRSNDSPRPAAVAPDAPEASPTPDAPDASRTPDAPDASPTPGTPDASPTPGTPDASPTPGTPDASRTPDAPLAATLTSYNGYGGFAPQGTEYVILVPRAADGYLRLPPRPWVNVIANPAAGFLISETGAGYTWHTNSSQNRLSPWYNDPVLDPPGEVLYLRDEESGAMWSPMPGPVPSGAAVEVRHGMGYTEFHQVSYGLRQSVTAFMPPRHGIKIVRLDITNLEARARRIGVASFVRWILGSWSDPARFVATAYDEKTGAITAVNRQNEPYHDRTAFAVLVVEGAFEDASYTASAQGFLGPDADPANPADLGSDLDRRTGAGLDPCAAFRRTLIIDPGETRSAFFLLGEVTTTDEAADLIDLYGSAVGSTDALEATRSLWDDLTSRMQISTPVPEIDVMVNGWLTYQNLSCRLWGRSAFYQSGGAIGFRDQLQDASAFAATRPQILRDQILLHAAHQFEDGDVMHWWHPPRSRGPRTRFADDLLWLPYATLDYVAATGDRAILDEIVSYLAGPLVPPGEDEILIEPEVSDLEESLYAHCCRALDRSLTTGSHGLPLIGSGDWNDGMNRVGREGRGESVWLGFFLFDILRRFIPSCEVRGDAERVAKYRAYADDLEVALNDAGWDGEWYRRAFYDNGAVIGSAHSHEGKIDALVQAWSVLSGAAPPDRRRQALDAMEHRLVSEDDGIIRLLSPPFDRTENDPGYIKGYIPGVRENGGQYTHAALWAVRALADDRRCERAAPLLAMLSPVSHSRSADDVARYQVEPYVVAADVYGEPPHVGRGGWTWYTGSAGWMYRVAVESILGFRILEGAALEIDPCIPSSWDGFEIRYRHPATDSVYDVHVISAGSSPSGTSDRRVTAVHVDGRPIAPVDGKARIPIEPDRGHYRVDVRLGG